MIRHAWTVICTQVECDPTTQNLVLSEIEQINLLAPVEQKSILPLPLEVVTYWFRDSADDVVGEGTAQLAIVFGSSDEPIAQMMLDLDFATFKRFRSRIRLDGFPFQGFGTYHVLVRFDGVELARVPLYINPPPEESPVPI